MSESCKKILIIKPSSLGDIILALPALSALRRSFPQAKINWLVRPEFAPILENHPHLDEIIPFDRKFFGKAWYNPSALAALISFIKNLRKKEFDLVIDLQGLFRTAAMAWLSGCRQRFGMSNAREFGHIFYSDKIPQNQDCIHLVDYYLKITKAAGATDNKVEFVLGVSPVAAESLSRKLADNGIRDADYAVLVPGSNHEDKCWPVERFAELADKITSEFCLSVVIAGSGAEQALGEKLKEATGKTVVNFAGITSLPELLALISRAALVVSNDTGPGHIAAALNKPQVMIFGRSNPARVAPYRRENCIAAIEPFARGFKADSADPAHNIKAVSVNQVYCKVREQLANARTAARGVVV